MILKNLLLHVFFIFIYIVNVEHSQIRFLSGMLFSVWDCGGYFLIFIFYLIGKVYFMKIILDLKERILLEMLKVLFIHLMLRI